MEYNDIVRKDLQLHWEILEFCNRIPWISDNLKIITSKYPWQDICIILWIACIVGVIEIGVHFFWVTSFNLCISFGKYFICKLMLYDRLLIVFLINFGC